MSRARYERALAKAARRDAALAALAATRLTDGAATQAALAAAGIAPLGGPATALELLRRPDVAYATLAAFLDASGIPGPEGDGWALPEAVAEQVEVEARYAHYIEAQRAQEARLALMEARPIARDFDYAALPSLRAEAREKLATIRPATLGQAGRIAGVTPGDLAALLVATERGARTGDPLAGGERGAGTRG